MILLDTSALIEFLNRTGSPADTAIEALIAKHNDRDFEAIASVSSLRLYRVTV